MPPEYPLAAPPEPPWWQDAWGTVLVGVLALIIGGLIGVAVGRSGNGAGRTVTEKQQAEAQTVTHANTRTVLAPPRVIVHTHTVTVTNQVSTPAPASSAQGAENPGGRPEEQTYRGSGSKNLGGVNVQRESTLEWTNDGASFSIVTNEGTLVNSSTHSGTTVLQQGMYNKFEVNANGNWTLKIVPK